MASFGTSKGDSLTKGSPARGQDECRQWVLSFELFRRRFARRTRCFSSVLASAYFNIVCFAESYASLRFQSASVMPASFRASVNLAS